MIVHLKRLFAISAIAIAAGGASQAQTFSTGPFTVPGNSNKLQIAEAAEANWKLGVGFTCAVVNESLEVTGTAAGCVAEKQLYKFTPQTADGKTSSDITFELRVNCFDPTEDGVAGSLQLDGMGFVSLPAGSTVYIPAANGDVIAVTTSGGVPPGPVGATPWGIGLALLFLVVGVLRLRPRTSPA